MELQKRPLTANIILIFLIFNIISVMIFTVYMQKSGQRENIEHTRRNMLEMAIEKSELLSIAFDRIETRAELIGLYMEEMLREDISQTLQDGYQLTKDGTIVRKKDENKKLSQQSNIIVPNTTPLSEEVIKEINVTEKLDRYFAQTIETEEVSWCYIVTRENLLRCSPYRNLSEFFTSDHSQISDIFYTQATDQYNPDHKAIWTDPYYDYLGTGWTMTCSQPVYDEDGELFGVICLDLSIEKVKEKYFSNFLSGEKGKICWMSRDGDVYYHTDYDQLTANQGETLEKNIFDGELSNSRRKALEEGVLSGTSGIEYFTEAGDREMLIFSEVADADSVIFIEMGMNDLSSFYSVDLHGIMVVALVNLILAVIFALILYYSFSKPMKRLVNQAKRISEGNYAAIQFEKEEALGNYEIGSLNDALRVMNENIVLYTESLLDKNREITVILEAIDEALMIVDPDGSINMQSKDSVKISEETLQQGISQVVSTGEPFSQQMVVEGEVYKNEYYPVLKEDEVKKVVVSTECITKTLLMEKELQQIEKMAGVGQLAAAIVHELKNILARVKGAAYILKLTNDGKTGADEICVIQKSVDEAEDVITTLLDFSGRDQNGSEMIHLATLINQILFLSKKEIIGKGISVIKEIDEAFYVLSNQREAIKVILQNIISNAIQAVDNDGKIIIRCGREGDNAVVRIQDNGGGIVISPKEKVFEPFLTTKDDGTGIGLWITKRLIDTLEGTITIGEPEGGGTEFTVSIPVSRKEA